MARPEDHKRSLEYKPALDGLRAIAVGSVIAFHFGVAGMSGGFLGVDVFFVISGYLITTLLIAESTNSGNISLAGFWGRRIRRLFPALAVTLISVSILAALLDSPSQLAGIRGDALSALFYVANWHFILSNQHYFTHFGPVSPLLHTWSLAVEEQFYLVWPPIVFLAYKFLTRRRVVAKSTEAGTPESSTRSVERVLVWVAVIGAIGSCLEMALMYHPGSDTSRIYYGSDTHSQVIFVGIVLAFIRPTDRFQNTSPSFLSMTPAVLALCFVGIMFHFISATSELLYRGGFLLVAIATAIVISQVVSQTKNPVTRLLSTPPFRYVGRISYGLYLYHWPVFIFLDSQNSGLTGWQLLASRLALTMAVSVVSFHLIETPIRNGFRGRISTKVQLRALLPSGLAVVLAAVVLSSTIPAEGLSSAIPKNAGHSQADPSVVLLVGDSVALTLGIGLSNPENAYHVKIENQGQLGCSIAEGNPIMVQGAQDNLPPCNPTTHQDWQTFWAQQVIKYHPDVVAIQLGRWEVVDRMHDGHWMHIGETAYDKYLTSQLSQAVSMFVSSGAKVALFSAPYYNDGENASGAPYDENQVSRVNEWNRLLGSVASKFKGSVSVIDVGGLLSGQDRYESVVARTPVRCPDGVHVSFQGGEFVAPYVLPQLYHMGLSAYTHRTRSSTISPVASYFVPKPQSNLKSLARQVQDKSLAPTCPF